MNRRHQILIAIKKIPRARVSTYGAVAKAAGLPRGARQVVAALRSASGTGLAWHRVVGAGGQIKTTGEDAMEQRFLLEMEGVRFRGKKVDMKAYEHRFGKKQVPAKPTSKKKIR